VINITIERKHLYVLAVIVTLAAMLVPVGAWASHRFNDVADSNPFHDDISWLANAEVTVGCGDGSSFCPEDAVTREQVAAFMRRLAVNQVVDAGRLDGIDSTGLLPGGTPPAGTTVRGGYWVSGDLGDSAQHAINWGFEMNEYPSTHFLPKGSSPTSDCPGTPDDPKAAAGHLCVYEFTATEDDYSFAGIIAGGRLGQGAADRFGAVLSIISNDGDGRWSSRGTWAASADEFVLTPPPGPVVGSGG